MADRFGDRLAPAEAFIELVIEPDVRLAEAPAEPDVAAIDHRGEVDEAEPAVLQGYPQVGELRRAFDEMRAALEGNRDIARDRAAVGARAQGDLVRQLLDALENLDDVQNVYTTAVIDLSVASSQ